MTIRNHRERAAASAKMQEVVAIGRTRSLTNDEQRDFDTLAGDVAHFDASNGRSGPAPASSPPSAPGAGAGRQHAAMPPTTARGGNLLTDDMRRRHGIPAPRRAEGSGRVRVNVPLSAAGLDAELRLAGLIR